VTWQCRWLEPLHEGLHGLRRLAWTSTAGPCAGDATSHDSGIVWRPRRVRLKVDGERHVYDTEAWPRTARSSRAWPRTCQACPYRFGPDDVWQDFVAPIWRRTDDGAEFLDSRRTDPGWPLPPMPIGSMYDTWWMHGLSDYVGADGLALTVVCPGGLPWNIDGPSSGKGAHWTRTGTPPLITAQPSISIGGASEDYHGWLGCNGVPPGVLSNDLAGRTYD